MNMTENFRNKCIKALEKKKKLEMIRTISIWVVSIIILIDTIIGGILSEIISVPFIYMMPAMVGAIILIFLTILVPTFTLETKIQRIEEPTGRRILKLELKRMQYIGYVFLKNDFDKIAINFYKNGIELHINISLYELMGNDNPQFLIDCIKDEDIIHASAIRKIIDLTTKEELRESNRKTIKQLETFWI